MFNPETEKVIIKGKGGLAAAMKRRREKSGSLTRREARRLKRREGSGFDMEFSLPKREPNVPPISLIWSQTQEWVDGFGRLVDYKRA